MLLFLLKLAKVLLENALQNPELPRLKLAPLEPLQYLAELSDPLAFPLRLAVVKNL